MSHDELRLGTTNRQSVMQVFPHHITGQSLIGGLLFLCSLTLTLLAWIVQRPALALNGRAALLLGLTAAVVASQWFPIRIGKATHLYLASVPLYLLSTVFAPPLAAFAVGVGMLTREISLCRRCGNTAGQVVAQAGRWMLLSLVASILAHLWSADYLLLLYSAALAGIVLWVGDVLTYPLVLKVHPLGPLRTMVEAVRYSYIGEPMQYLIAFLVLALLHTGLDWIGLAYIPVIGFCLALLYLHLQAIDASSPRQSTEAGAPEQEV